MRSSVVSSAAESCCCCSPSALFALAVGGRASRRATAGELGTKLDGEDMPLSGFSSASAEGRRASACCCGCCCCCGSDTESKLFGAGELREAAGVVSTESSEEPADTGMGNSEKLMFALNCCCHLVLICNAHVQYEYM